MNKAFKIVLMVCAVVLVLAVSGSMIYYFVIFRPGIERAEIRLQEQKATEEVVRKENLEKCLKEAEDWKATAFNGLFDVKDSSDLNYERIMKIIQDEYQNKIDNCNSNYGK